MLQMPQSIRVNLVCRGALVLGFGKPNTIRYYLNQYLISVYIVWGKTHSRGKISYPFLSWFQSNFVFKYRAWKIKKKIIWQKISYALKVHVLPNTFNSIKFTSPIYWFSLCLEISQHQIYWYFS